MRPLGVVQVPLDIGLLVADLVLARSQTGLQIVLIHLSHLSPCQNPCVNWLRGGRDGGRCSLRRRSRLHVPIESWRCRRRLSRNLRGKVRRDETIHERSRSLFAFQKRDNELRIRLRTREILAQLPVLDEPLTILRPRTHRQKHDLLDDLVDALGVLGLDDVLKGADKSTLVLQIQLEKIRLGEVEVEILSDLLAVETLVRDTLLENMNQLFLFLR